jgi:hypothetical protein
MQQRLFTQQQKIRMTNGINTVYVLGRLQGRLLLNINKSIDGIDDFTCFNFSAQQTWVGAAKLPILPALPGIWSDFGGFVSMTPVIIYMVECRRLSNKPFVDNVEPSEAIQSIICV